MSNEILSYFLRVHGHLVCLIFSVYYSINLAAC